MMGNIFEWTEDYRFDYGEDIPDGYVTRSVYGGSFDNDESYMRNVGSTSGDETSEGWRVGLRVVALGNLPAEPIAPPEITLGHAVEIGWNSISGITYQVQYSTNLVSTNWFNLGATVIGTGTNQYQLDSTRGSAARYYRVITD